MRYEGALRSPIYDLCRQTVTVYHACYNPLPEGIGIVRLWLPRATHWLPIWNAILERGLENE